MTHDRIYTVPHDVEEHAHYNRTHYEEAHARAAADPEGFWAEQAAKRLEWAAPWETVKDVQFTSPVHIRWFAGGKLNVCHNCVDRHLKDKADHTAILWEGDDPAEDARITYRQLHAEVCRLANVLKDSGVRKGDRVTIYMPMIPEAAYAMLACARIGAVHSVVFGGFSADALRKRILDCASTCVITADEGIRGGKTVPLKRNVDTALEGCPDVRSVLVFPRTGADVPRADGRDLDARAAMQAASADCPAEPMDAEDPLFILYTSGSTGTPKGVLHTSAGYLLYAAFTHEAIFDYHPDDVYWCTADVGWITGHSYILYGPLANGATTLMFEGVPTYPDASRFWQVVDKHNVNIFYTAPTAIRALMREGNDFVTRTLRSSLRILGSVGEPINPEAWEWYYHTVGEGRCPIVDTWWQTETGGILITPLPGATDLKPGYATRPFFGVRPVLLDKDGNEQTGEAEGFLCLGDSWPGQMRTVYGDHQRFEETYFSQFPGYYFSGDGARRDADGDYRITGRVDDVLNVSGHRLGTAELEAALNEHAAVVESAIIGIPHEVKGEGIVAFAILEQGSEAAPGLEQELRQWLRREIGPIAAPEAVHLVPGLPKTRSGKIMRRILRKIATGDATHLGDTSTLVNPEVVETLKALYGNGADRAA